MNRRTLPLWMILGLALGVALGPVVDALRGGSAPVWAAAGTAGPAKPGTTTNGSPGFTATGNVSAAADAVLCSTADNTADTATTNGQFVTYSNFGLAVPANSTIDGITVGLAAKGNNGALSLRLVDRTGTLVGSPIAISPLTAQSALYSAGGTTNTWGAALTQADVVNAAFGVRVTTTTNVNINLYCLNVTVNYTSDPFVIAKDGSTFSTTITGAVNQATGLGKGQAKYGGRISVKNVHTTQNATYTATIGTVSNTNAAFKNALKVSIAARTDSACPAAFGDAANSPVVTDALYDTNGVTAGEEGAGLNIASARPLNAGVTEHLCYYFSLPAGTPDTAAGGQVNFSLTFNGTFPTAN